MPRDAWTGVALSLAVPMLAAGTAVAGGWPVVSFGALLMHPGAGMVQIHLPVFGLTAAVLIGGMYARLHRTAAGFTCLWAAVVFAAVQLMAVLGIQWDEGVYDVVLAARPGISSYVAFANLYVVGVLTAASVLAMVLILRFRTMRPSAALTFRIMSLVPVPFLALIFLVGRGAWGGVAVFAAASAMAAWIAASDQRVHGLSGLVRRLGSDGAMLFALALVAFVVRYAWGHHVLSLTGSRYVVASDDGPAYHALGSQIASGSLPAVGDAVYWGGMLYWYLIGGIYRLAGIGNFGAVIFVQAILGACIPLATYVIARRLFHSKWLAAISGAFCALHLMLIFLSGVIGMEALYLPLLYAGLAAMVWILTRETRSAAAGLGLGALFGIANIARPELVGYPVLLVLLTGVVAWRRRWAPDAVRDLRLMALVCVGFFVTWAGQGLFNYAAYGIFQLVSSQAAVCFPLGNWGVRENVVLNSMGFNPFADLGRSVQAVLAEPATVARLVVVGFVKRLRLFVFLPGAGRFDPLTLTSSNWIHDFFPAVRVNFSSLVEAYELVFTAIGLGALYFVKPRVLGAALLLFLAYLAALNAVVDIPSARHRASLLPLCIIAVVKGVDVILRRLRRADSTADSPMTADVTSPWPVAGIRA